MLYVRIIRFQPPSGSFSRRVSYHSAEVHKAEEALDAPPAPAPMVFRGATLPLLETMARLTPRSEIFLQKCGTIFCTPLIF